LVAVCEGAKKIFEVVRRPVGEGPKQTLRFSNGKKTLPWVNERECGVCRWEKRGHRKTCQKMTHGKKGTRPFEAQGNDRDTRKKEHRKMGKPIVFKD